MHRLTRLFLLLFFLLLLCSCGKEQKIESSIYFQPPGEQEILLLFQSGETELRTNQESHHPSAGELIHEEAGIITKEGAHLILQDHHGNLFYLYPNTHLAIIEERDKQTYHLHQGKLEIYSPYGTPVTTEEFLLDMGKGILTLEVDHQQTRISCFSARAEMLMTNLTSDERSLINEEASTQLNEYIQDLPVLLLPGKIYSWYHHQYRDSSRNLSAALFEMQSPNTNMENLIQFLRLASERPEPENRTLNEDSQLEKVVNYLMQLQQQGKVLFHKISVEPDQAEIRTGPFSGQGTMELPMAENRAQAVFLNLRGYKDQEELIHPTETEQTTLVYLQRKSSQTYEINVQPPEARIYINDLFAGKGQMVLMQKPGEEIHIRMELEGYNDQELYLEDIGIYPEKINVELKKTLLGQYFVSYEDPIGIAFLKDMFIVADRKGNITSVMQNRGIRPWGYATSNSPNDWSSPVIAFDQIYFSGKRTLSVYNPVKREVSNVYTLNSRSTHQYGRRIIPFGNTIALPTDDSIILLTPDLEKTLRTINIPGGLLMTPLSYQNQLYCVSIDGRIYKIDRNGKITASGYSNAFSPTAMTIAVQNGLGYISDKKGLVLCFDLETLNVLWETPIPDQGRLVFRDIMIEDKTLYVYSEGFLYLFDSEKGDFLETFNFRFETPPLVENGLLYGAVNNRRFIIMNLENRVILEDLELSANPCSPVFSNQGIALIGMENGRIMIMNQPRKP